MKDRKYTVSEIETFQLIGFALLISVNIAWFILFYFNQTAGGIAIPFQWAFNGYLVYSDFLRQTLLDHNEKLDKYEEVKLQAEAQAEVERTRIESQIWVSE
jgi:hypothetical protein